MRAASSTAATPEPSSSAPCAGSHESKWAPRSTTSSFAAPPGRSATTLRSLYGVVSNVFFTSSASVTGPFARSRRSSSASSFATEIAGSGPFG